MFVCFYIYVFTYTFFTAYSHSSHILSKEVLYTVKRGFCILSKGVCCKFHLSKGSVCSISACIPRAKHKAWCRTGSQQMDE